MNANNVQLTYEIILLVHNPPKKETYQRSNPFHQAISNKSEFIDHRISGIYKTGAEKIPGKSFPPELKKQFLLTKKFGAPDLAGIFSAPVLNTYNILSIPM